jgi:hypothetical protein
MNLGHLEQLVRALRGARTRGHAERMLMRGAWHITHRRNGILLAEYDIKNAITDVGMNYLLDAAFNSGSAIGTWYIGLIDATGYTAVDAADTMSSHAGWSELTAYSNASRPTWSSGAAAARAITNGTAVDFNMNATNTVKGLFIASDNTKSGTTGTLWSAATFGTPSAVNNGDTLGATYSLSG